MHQSVRTYKLIEPAMADEKPPVTAMVFFAVSFLMLFALLILFLSERPTYSLYDKDISLIKFTIKYPSKHASEGKELTKKDTETKLKHMRKTNSPFSQIRMEYERKRLPVYVEVDLDNKNVLSRTYYPTGLKKDGPTFAYEEIPVTPGSHEIKIRMRDSKEGSPFDYTFEKKIDLVERKVTVFDFDREDKTFYVMEIKKEIHP